MFTLLENKKIKFCNKHQKGITACPNREKYEAECRITLLKNFSSADFYQQDSSLLAAYTWLIEKSAKWFSLVIQKVFFDLHKMEKVLESSGLDTLAVWPVALVNGDPTGKVQCVDGFAKTSRIFTGYVARGCWMQWRELLRAADRDDWISLVFPSPSKFSSGWTGRLINWALHTCYCRNPSSWQS